MTSSTPSTGPAAITAGDYNGDGLHDFFFMRNSADEFGYNELHGRHVHQHAARPPRPTFGATIFPRTSISPRASRRPASTSSGRPTTSRPSTSTGTATSTSWPSARTGSTSSGTRARGTSPSPSSRYRELAYDARTGFTGGRGGSCVAAADFDADGDVDVVGGTVGTTAYLVYYENDGAAHFTRSGDRHHQPDLRRARGRHPGPTTSPATAGRTSSWPRTGPTAAPATRPASGSCGTASGHVVDTGERHDSAEFQCLNGLHIADRRRPTTST
ncbi:MAG: hypothetical protein MZV64_49300 [Ignavibacteriales bacterium]|nr:hypothetical protein [Ignavibacteriales bacterium]